MVSLDGSDGSAIFDQSFVSFFGFRWIGKCPKSFSEGRNATKNTIEWHLQMQEYVQDRDWVWNQISIQIGRCSSRMRNKLKQKLKMIKIENDTTSGESVSRHHVINTQFYLRHATISNRKIIRSIKMKYSKQWKFAFVHLILSILRPFKDIQMIIHKISIFFQYLLQCEAAR